MDEWRNDLATYGGVEVRPGFKFWSGPTGNTIKGHTLDVRRKPFEEALRAYDPFLYVKWNPKKCKGWGAWEIRRRPETKTVVDVTEYEGNLILILDYMEHDLVANVLSCAFLNYDQLRKIKEMDTWAIGPKQWIQDLEYREQKMKEAAQIKARRNMREAARYFKSEISDFKEFVRSGGNPNLIALHWDSVKESD